MTANLVKPLPILPTADNVVPSASPNPSAPEILATGRSRPRVAPIPSIHDQSARSSEPAPSLKPPSQRQTNQ
ncbi:hypothetical protein FRC00_006881, partial [Tulasnella sp. 408]